jgi:hypothetical protein
LIDNVHVSEIMLVNNVDDATMGFLVEKEHPENESEIVKEYEPAVMWNLDVKRYILRIYVY